MACHILNAVHPGIRSSKRLLREKVEDMGLHLSSDGRLRERNQKSLPVKYDHVDKNIRD